MAYKIFENKSTRLGTPAITIMKNGRMGLNATATQIMHKNAVEFVLLMWDEDQLRIALKPVSSKRDTRAYKLSYGTNNSGSAFSAKSFLDFVGWNFSVKQVLPSEWNDEEGLLESRVKPEYLKDARQQKLLPVEGGRKQSR